MGPDLRPELIAMHQPRLASHLVQPHGLWYVPVQKSKSQKIFSAIRDDVRRQSVIIIKLRQAANWLGEQQRRALALLTRLGCPAASLRCVLRGPSESSSLGQRQTCSPTSREVRFVPRAEVSSLRSRSRSRENLASFSPHRTFCMGTAAEMRLAHRLRPRSFLLSYPFLYGRVCLCSFSVRDFVDPFRLSQR
jgi:hypothetical protein